jgi:glucosamine--fructose-6-phosphate aminotransferase (isomerizing)|tara:strand:+ start:6061 stop:6387 length:327 start_codon:yes stop_codon:yes gene_type:complete
LPVGGGGFFSGSAFFVIGSGVLIGALNIKEMSYLHAEAFSARELKHGVIVLIEQDVPMILFIAEGDTYMAGVAVGVKARGALGVAISNEPLLHNPDRPQNLAKSVSVQ